MTTTIIESGHFYLDHWFTHLALQWWKNGQHESKLLATSESMLFIDDVHPGTMSSEREQSSTVAEVNIRTDQIITPPTQKTLEIIHSINSWSPHETISPNHIILESELEHYIKIAIDQLLDLPKKKKAKQSKNGSLMCSGNVILLSDDEDNKPTCVMYDIWLTLLKSRIAHKALNILPAWYELQQSVTHRIVAKILPEFCIETKYY